MRQAINIAPEAKCNTTRYYANKLEIPESEITLKYFDQVGKKEVVPEKVESFIFKFVRNRLNPSAQRSHFIEIDKNCLLYSNLSNSNTTETAHHMFFERQHYKTIH